MKHSHRTHRRRTGTPKTKKRWPRIGRWATRAQSRSQEEVDGRDGRQSAIEERSSAIGEISACTVAPCLRLKLYRAGKKPRASITSVTR